jgi:protein-S-isoprenylcysteine O-methyltransferase Ste14
VGHAVRDAPLAVLWLAWLAYWFNAARNVKTTLRRESLTTRVAAIVPTLLAAVLLAFHGLPPRWINAQFVPQTAVTYWIGLLLTVGGLAFALWARVHLGRNWSGVVTVKENHELIRTGPYGWVRHPIYTGVLLSILGTAVVLAEWRGLLAFGCLTIAFLVKLRREEQIMGETFPDEYPRYRAEVPALVPFIGGRAATPKPT